MHFLNYFKCLHKKNVCTDSNQNDELDFYWKKSVSDLFLYYKTTENGLTEKEAKDRQLSFGKNEIEKTNRYSIIKSIMVRFKNYMVLLLLWAAIVLLLIGEVNSAIIIFTMLFISLGLDIFQEYRTAKTTSLLQETTALQVTVLRNGAKVIIPATDIVPGDIVELLSGDVVPADGIILDCNNVFVNASIFTGESFPVEKSSNFYYIKDKENAIGSLNSVLMGMAITSGWLKMIVCKTGQSTYLGSIVNTLKVDKPSSQFLKNTQEFGLFLSKLAFILIITSFLIHFYSGKSFFDILLFSTAIGISITPEFLPMIISVSLARGAIRLSKKGVIVKKISSLYDLGCIDILCTDKTGTLTESIITLESYTDWQGKVFEKPLEMAYMTSSLSTSFNNTIDNAIISKKNFDISSYKKISEIPFDHLHRRTSVIVEKNGQQIMISKGPLDDILNLCRYLETEDGITNLDDISKEIILKKFQDLSQKGIRLIGVAMRNCQNDDIAEKDLLFLGILSFSDVPKKSSQVAIQSLLKYGVDVKIISGDNEYVTKHLCDSLGFHITDIAIGSELTSLKGEELRSKLLKSNIFCRVTPDQKKQIVEFFKKEGHTVGFLGDGINDIAAIFSADVGIAVNNSSPAVKNSANFILLKKNLSLVEQGVIEGRKTFVNIMKYAMMCTSSNFGYTVSMMIGSFFLPFFPLIPIQIILGDLLYDLSVTSLPFDTVEHENYKSPAKWDTLFIKKFMLFFGILSSVFDCFIFVILMCLLKTPEPVFQTVWFMESLVTQIFAVFLIRTRQSVFKSKPNKWLFLTIFLIGIIGVYIPYSPIAQYFGFVNVSSFYLLGIFAATFTFMIAIEFAKRYFYKVVTPQ